MTTEQLRAQVALLDKLLADAKAARQERSLAWYNRQFHAQQALRCTAMLVIPGRVAA